MLGIQISRIRRDPEVDVNRGKIRVHVYAFQSAIVFVGPNLIEQMTFEYIGKAAAQIVSPIDRTVFPGLTRDSRKAL